MFDRKAYMRKYCQRPEQKAYMRKYRQQPEVKIWLRAHTPKIRLDVIAGLTKFSMRCSHCGATKYLCVHHLLADGFEHRQCYATKSGALGNASKRIWLDIIRSDFDRCKFQVVCRDCHPAADKIAIRKRCERESKGIFIWSVE